MVCERAAWSRAGLHDPNRARRSSLRWSADAVDGAVRQRICPARRRREEHHAHPRGPRCPSLQRRQRHRRAGTHAAQLAELESGRILLHVDAAGARYPLRIDPFVQQGEKLTGSGERGEEGAFGYSVALSSNGEYALIGGSSDNGKVGAAWVFLRSGTTWTQQGPKLTAKEEAGAGEFGASVSLSEKGEYALIGGPGDNEKAGAAWVFLRTGTAWAQQASSPRKSAKRPAQANSARACRSRQRANTP